MKKVVIIGSSGVGKSTLARKLGKILKIEVFHLDRYFWQPKWKKKPREARCQILKELVQKDQWIIEGNYLDTSDIRLKAADTIIFLDAPGFICFWRVLYRYLRYRKRQRPDLAEGCPEKLGAYFILKVLGFPSVKRKGLYALLSELESEKCVYVLHSKRVVEGFLWKLERGQTLEECTLENAFAQESNYAPVSVGLT